MYEASFTVHRLYGVHGTYVCTYSCMGYTVRTYVRIHVWGTRYARMYVYMYQR